MSSASQALSKKAKKIDESCFSESLAVQALLEENPTGLHFNPHAAAGAAWHEEAAADPVRQPAVREAAREATWEAAIAAAREAVPAAAVAHPSHPALAQPQVHWAQVPTAA